MMKKTMRKTVAIMLSVALFIGIFGVMPTATAKTKEQASKKSSRIVEEKTEYSTTYQSADGKKETEFYSEPIRYREEKNGELIEYDSNLKQSESRKGYFENKSGDKKNFIPEILSEDTPIMTENEKYQISTVPNNGNIKGSEEGDTVVYKENESKQILYEYKSLNQGIKETVYLYKKPDDNRIVSEITLKNCFLGTVDDTSENGISKEIVTVSGSAVTIYDAEQKNIVGSLPAGFMEDATGDNSSEECHYEIELIKRNKKQNLYTYKLALVIEDDYFNRAKLTYPLRIDPTVTWGDKAKIQDTYVASGEKKDINFSTSSVLMCGKVSSEEKVRSYIKFDGLPEYVKNKYISSATLTLAEASNSAKNVSVQIRSLTKDFTPNTMTYENIGTTMGDIQASISTTGINGNQHDINLTEFMKKVARGTITCGGVALYSPSETSSTTFTTAKFYSSKVTDKNYIPKLKLIYYDEPVQPYLLSVTPEYIESGDMVTIDWKGIYSTHLDYVQYQLKKYEDEINKEGEIVRKYSDNTIIGRGTNDQSGLYHMDCGDLTEGCYKLSVRGVDTQGNISKDKSVLFHVDNTKPVWGTVNVTSKSGKKTNSMCYSNEEPTVFWKNIKEKHPESLEMSLNGGTYFKIAESISGSYDISKDLLSGTGMQTITLRMRDKVSNVSSVKKLLYYYDVSRPNLVECSVLPETTSENLSNELPRVFYRVSDESCVGTVEYSINGRNFVTAQTLAAGKSAQGNFVIPESEFTTSGSYDIMIRTKDSAGNASGVKTLRYNYRSDSDTVSDYVPTQFIAEEKEGKTVLSWKKPEGGVPDTIHYRIYRGKTPDFTPSDETVLCTTVQDNMYTVYQDDSEHGIMYYYKVCAAKVSGNTVKAISSYKTLASKTEGTQQIKSQLGEKQRTAYEALTMERGSAQVNKKNGNFVYRHPGMNVDTGCGSVNVTPIYNSESSRETTLGIGWCLPSDTTMLREGDNFVYYDETGGRFVFEQDTNGYFCNKLTGLKVKETQGEKHLTYSDLGESDEVVKYSCVLEDAEKELYYDSEGKLVLQTEANDNFIVYHYDENHHLLKEIKLSTGKTVLYQYSFLEKSGKARLTNVWNGETHLQGLQFDYKDGELLVICERGKGNAVRYTSCVKEDDVVKTITNPGGGTYRINYEQERVLLFEDAKKESIVFNYEDGACTVQNKNKDGDVISENFVTYDSLGRIVTEKDASGLITRNHYSNEQYPYEVTKTERNVAVETLENDNVKFDTVTITSTTSYDKMANTVEENDGAGRITTYEYDDTQNPTQATRVTEEESQSGDLLSENTFVYDEEGNELKTVDEIEDKVTTSAYDENGNCTNERVCVKGKESEKTNREYDKDGNVVKESSVSGTTENEVVKTYDEIGNVLSENNCVTGVITYYTYNNLYELVKTKTVYPTGVVEIATKSYDALGQIKKQTDPDGTMTEYTYDSAGMLTKKTVSKDNLLRTENYDYSYEDIVLYYGGGKTKVVPHAAKKVIKNEKGTVISIQYIDGAGHMVRSFSSGIYTDYLVDASGNTVATAVHGRKIRETNQKLTVQLYNANGLVTHTIENPEVTDGNYHIGEQSSCCSKEYDDSSNLCLETDANGNKTSYTYSEDKKLDRVTTADGNGNAYQYNVPDGENFKDITTNARGYQNYVLNNAAGQEIAQVDKGEEGKEIRVTYAYDKQGNKVKETFGTGAYLVYEYNDKQELIVKHSYNASDVEKGKTTYDYDKGGNIIRMNDYAFDSGELKPIRSTVYEYDALGKLTMMAEIPNTDNPSEKEITSHKLVYSYDEEERLKCVTYPVQQGVKELLYTYTSEGWIKQINAITSDDTNTVLRYYTYNEYGQIKCIRDCQDYLEGRDNYLVKSYEYDLLGRVVSMSTVNEGERDILQSDVYSYDKNGNILSKEEQKGGNVTKTLYTYNNMNRLVTSTQINGENKTVTNYKYDSVGNQISVTNNKKTVTSTYNGLNQITEQKEDNGCISYQYDEAGNVLKTTSENATIKYEYDAENRLTKVSECGEGEETITQQNQYNGNGQRIMKAEGEHVTNYYYQGKSLYKTSDKKDNIQSMYLYGNDGNSISLEEYMNDGVSCYTYVKDVQGSITQVLDDTGKIVTSYDYDDYGKTTKTGNSTCNVLAYSGGVYDEKTGYYYLNSRYYNPNNGNFLSQDSYRGEHTQQETWNLYGYCSGNPVSFVDPSGHAPSRATQHFNYNRQKHYSGYRYCYGQANGGVGDMRYGNYTLSFNGCEVIATYNAIVARVGGIHLAWVIWYYEVYVGLWRDGYFGTKPGYIGACLRYFSVKNTYYRDFSKISKQVNSRNYFILVFLNNKYNVFKGIHTVFVKRVGKHFEVYNRGNKDQRESIYKSLPTIIGNGYFLCGYKL